VLGGTSPPVSLLKALIPAFSTGEFDVTSVSKHTYEKVTKHLNINACSWEIAVDLYNALIIRDLIKMLDKGKFRGIGCSSLFKCFF